MSFSFECSFKGSQKLEFPVFFNASTLSGVNYLAPECGIRKDCENRSNLWFRKIGIFLDQLV